MGTMQERLVELTKSPSTDRESLRVELTDLAVQAVEHAILSEVGAPIPFRSLSYIASSLRVSDPCSVAGDFNRVVAALESSVNGDDAWEALCSAVSETIRRCEAGGVGYSRRVRGTPVCANHVTVESVAGTRSFGLWHGDIALESRADLIIASAFTQHDGTLRGQVVRALRRRHGAPLKHAPLLHLDADVTTTYSPSSGDSPAILVVSVPTEMDSWSSEEWSSRYGQWIRGCFASMAALEALGHNHRIAAMPVLFGNRWTALEEPARLMIRESTAWLRRARVCEEIRLVVFQADEVSRWSDAMDTVLGRVAIHAPDDAEVARHRSDLLAWRAKASHADAALVKALSDALVNPDNLSAKAICNAARQTAEALAKEWIGHLQKGTPPSNLNQMIEKIQHDVPPMITAHLQLLRVIGNALSHNDDSVLSGTTTSAQYIAEVLRSTMILVRLRPAHASGNA